MKALIVAGLILLLSGCVAGERMVRIMESDAQAGRLLIRGQAGGIRVETSAEPLTGSVIIIYQGNRAVVEYESD